MSKTFCRHLIAGLLCGIAAARGQEAPAKFLGANSCASSGCHGGGSTKMNQFLTWSVKDFHSQRPPATLTTARSKQIAEALNIKDPTVDVKCTTCHAPLHNVPEALRGESFKVSEGVSCESCHGPAENWLRAHTRTDYTRADRTAAGMRDLQNLYVRANTCVACHQVVSQPLLKAGHPELIFELDGQSVAEPKHWSAERSGNGAQAWIIGQAVALREMSWQLTQEQAPDEKLKDRWLALYWLMDEVRNGLGLIKSESVPVASATAENASLIQRGSDADAKYYSGLAWSGELTSKALSALAGSGGSFRDASVSQPLQARKAERLVLALDRLTAAENNHKGDAELNQLFTLAQSVPDFEAKGFADVLDKFSAALNAP